MSSPAGRGRERALRLATRGSALARHQAMLVAELLRVARPDLRVDLVVVATRGDREGDVPLDRIGGQGAFVKEVQAAVLEGRADVAVHSAKDLPPVAPDGLVLAAVPERADARDALVGRRLAELPAGGVVATGSARRRAQLANARPDLTFVELRGNMATRVRRADSGSVDAVVVASAAMDRLGWADRVAEVLPTSVMLPQVGQGALGLECRADDAATLELLAAADDGPSHRAVLAERAVLASAGGSCTLPVAGWAAVDGAEVRLEAMVASGDGRIVLRAARRGTDPGAVGRELARHLLEDCGGAELEGWSAGAPTPGGPAPAGEARR